MVGARSYGDARDATARARGQGVSEQWQPTASSELRAAEAAVVHGLVLPAGHGLGVLSLFHARHG